MAEFVHLICLGIEPLEIHTSGLTKLGGKEAVVFHPPKLGPELQEKLGEVMRFVRYGMPVRPVEVGQTYREALPIALSEVPGYVTPGTWVAINAGTGRRAVVQAIIDATYGALLDLHPVTAANDDYAAGAFRYFPTREVEGEEPYLDMAPLFNVASPQHREIVLATMEQDEPISGKELHEIVSSMRAPEQRDKYDTFRRYFYAVRRWLKHVPGFIQEKGDRYRYSLR
ncbi:MAG TPA: hypothetical protein VF944_03920 [Candidatus Bathyarchaeia archaeon]